MGTTGRATQGETLPRLQTTAQRRTALANITLRAARNGCTGLCSAVAAAVAAGQHAASQQQPLLCLTHPEAPPAHDYMSHCRHSTSHMHSATSTAGLPG